MSGKQKEEFFNELDKTADMLRTFKPSVERPKEVNFDEIEKLYNDLEESEEQERLESQRIVLERTAEMEKLEKIINDRLSQEKVERTADKKEQQEDDKKPSIEREELEKKTEEVKKVEKEKSSSIKKTVAPKVKRELTREEKIARLKAKKRREALAARKKALEEEAKQAPKVEAKKEVKATSKKKTKRKLKKGVFELIFCACSFLFMVTCICIYGMRLVKYYKIYNPKNESGEVLALLTTEIARNSSIVYEGEGLYMQGGDYVYKGANVNNYVEYGNLLWRIIKTNSDGTMDIMLDNYINVLPYSQENADYTDSDIHKWLNEYFIKYLDKDYLTGTKVCLDPVSDLNSYSCNTSNTDRYVRILSVKEYLNSKVDDSTYVGDENSSLWLSTVSNDGAWQVNGNSLSVAEESRALGIKPVVTLRIGIALLDGSGTKEDPYKIEKEKDGIHIGDYVQLGNDIYVVYKDTEDKLALALNDYLPTTYRFDIDTNLYNLDTMYSLAYYLNNIYYNSLPYKEMIIDSEWSTGLYVNSYQDIAESKITTKIGLLSLEDLKFNNELSEYFLLNGIDTSSYLYGNELVTSKPNISRKIRPCIVIQTATVKSGDGSLENPYVVEG